MGGSASDYGVLRNAFFRQVWLCSISYNFGTLVLTVGAGWAMIMLDGTAQMVALVQTATFAPVLLFGLLTGAVADKFDRRIVGLVALSISIAGAAFVSVLDITGGLSPMLLLLACFTVGTGSALFGPTWQSGMADEVTPDELPQAVALNSVGYNVARSFGPAIGGALVAIAGALAAFVLTTLSFLPVTATFLRWRRIPVSS